MKSHITYALSLLIFLLLSSHAHAIDRVINDKAALADLKTAKAVFLIDIGDARKMNFYLEVIQGTAKGMQNQGVKPDFVLVYIGPSVKHLTTAPTKDIEESLGDTLMDIENNVSMLSSMGIKQEVCAVATGVFAVDNNTLFDDLKLVGDGFISLIGYQAQGYHLVPVF